MSSEKERPQKEGRAMSIQRFDSRNIGKVLDSCKEALEIVAEEYGLVLQQKRCSYRSNEMPVAFKLIAPERGEDGEAVDPRETEFRQLAGQYGFSPDDYGKLFKTFHGVYRLCGIKPRARKYPLLGEHIDNGKTYKFAEAVVRAGLKNEEASP